MAESKNGFQQKSIPKSPTGIAGLDQILLGGIPEGRTTLISGGPGTGKTVFGLEFLIRGALMDEPGIFITLEEDEGQIRRNAQALGWDVEALEEQKKLLIMHIEVPIDLMLSGGFTIDGLMAIIGAQAKEIGAKRIVIDAIDRLLNLFPNKLSRHNQLHSLNQWLRNQHLTAIITAKKSNTDEGTDPILDYILDCIIRLDQRVVGQVMTRRVRVLKYRGSGFLSNEFPYLIGDRGVEIMPISSSHYPQSPLGDFISTGNKQLDILLGGGFRTGASIVIAGSSGTGKTTLVSSIAAASTSLQKKVLFVSFEESQQSIVSTMLNSGIDLRPGIAANNLFFLNPFPEAHGVEDHLFTIVSAIRKVEPEIFIMEAISATNRIGSSQAAFDLLVRLINICKEKKITSIFTNQTRSDPSWPYSNPEYLSGIGISSLIDSLILLEQKWDNNMHRRRLLIIKSRASTHSHQYQSFKITDQGLSIIESQPGETDQSQKEWA